MTRCLASLAVLACLAAPAFADTCSAAIEAATRAALQSAEAAGRRTATVRVTCSGERQMFVLHRSNTPAGTSITVRDVSKPVSRSDIASGNLNDFSASSAARVIRVGKPE